jgi:ferric-dicitrate binding protein FerR (iron transport regulator)
MRNDDDSGSRLLEKIRRLHKWRSVPLPDRLGYTSVRNAVAAGLIMWCLALMSLDSHHQAPPAPNHNEQPRLLAVGGAASEVVMGNALQVTIFEAISGAEEKLLEDGTLVTMSNGAKMGVQFSPQERKVHLFRKDALFDVAKDPSRPFKVSAGDITATAVGTQFRVISGDCVEVHVLEGMVRVSVKGDQPGAPTIKLTEGMSTDWPLGCSGSADH